MSLKIDDSLLTLTMTSFFTFVTLCGFLTDTKSLFALVLQSSSSTSSSLILKRQHLCYAQKRGKYIGKVESKKLIR